MASKFGMAGGIPERRVRPVWDAIDSRQFKNALKLSTALLSKYPNSSYALALKALILERMGKLEEALSVCINAKELLYKNDSILIDDLTLSTLQIVFQRLDHLDMATGCYEYACGKFPNNLELMMGLFNCYVREYSYVKQQQIAIKMYKIAGEERFLLWAVCSIQLQVFCGNGGEKLLQLAEGLLKKHIGSHSLHEPEALSVYISLLEQQAKYGDALEVLSGNLGSLIMIEVDKLRIQGRLLARAGDYDGAAEIFQKVLRLCPDDWECFLHYLGCLLEDDCSLPRVANSPSSQVSTSMDCCKHRDLAEDVFDSRISRASEFVKQLISEVGSDSIRGPGLANLEIERRKLIFGKVNADKLMEDLIIYFSRFGHLACFAADVEVFLQVLPGDKKKQLLEKLVKNVASSSTASKNVLGQHITLFKIRELIGDVFSLSDGDLVGFAVQMTEMFCQNLPLSKDLDVQESVYGEEFLIMTCNVLVQLFWRTQHIGYLLEAIMVLELGLTVRRYVSQYKVLLVHLYSYWNALPLAYERYKSLDVKNILLESVSHHILPQMLTSPMLVDTTDLLKGYLRFMDEHLKETADLTFLAYRHRNYSKVIEFVQFRERLQRSNQYLTAKIEGSILHLKRKSNSIEEAESALESLNYGSDFLDVSNEIQSKKLAFNEDLQLRPWWTPLYDKNYLSGPYEDMSHPRENLRNEVKEAEAKVTKTIEKRSLLPRLIHLSIQCASSSVKGNSNVNGFDSKVSSELKSFLECYANFLGLSFQDAAELVIGVSCGQKSFEVFSPNLIDWMNFAVFLNAWNLNSHDHNSSDGQTFAINWQVLCSLLEQCISAKISSTQPLLSSPGTDLSILVQLVTEPLSWHGLIIQSCVRSSLPSGKKKKKGGPSEHSNTQLSNEIKNSISSLYGMIDQVKKWLKEQTEKPVAGNVDILLSSFDGEQNDDAPGKVVKILENLVSSENDLEVGERIFQAIRSWNPADAARKIVAAQGTALMEFLNVCESKAKVLQALKVQI